MKEKTSVYVVRWTSQCERCLETDAHVYSTYQAAYKAFKDEIVNTLTETWVGAYVKLQNGSTRSGWTFKADECVEVFSNINRQSIDDTSLYFDITYNYNDYRLIIELDKMEVEE